MATIGWTLEKVDPRSIKVAAHLGGELGVPAIALIEDLERIYEPGRKDGTTLVIDSGFVAVKGNRAIHFPLKLLEGKKNLSLPVLLFNMLFGPPSHLCYVWSRLDHLRRVDPSVLGIIHEALFVVGEWYADIASNPPIVDLAIMVERPDLRMIVSRFAFLLRVCTGSLRGSTLALREVFRPWHLRSIDPFWKDMKRAILGSVICVRPVQLASQKPPVAKTKPGHPSAHPDFFFDGNIGLVCCPSDKLLLIAVLFCSKEIGLVKRATLSPLGFLEEHRVPDPIRNLLRQFVDISTKPIKPPLHYAPHHHPALQGHPG
jgi:hypothetical protein